MCAPGDADLSEKDILMGLLNLLFSNPVAFVLLAVPLLYSIILHELAHGWVADRMGDPTARLSGRLSLNPLKHLDPLGTALLFIVGFGWAKPVPVNINNLRKEGKALLWVSAAGIITNLILAFISLFMLKLFAFNRGDIFGTIFMVMARINILLAALNLIPIPPLDGSRILSEFLPYNMKAALARIEPYGIFILLAMLMLNWLDPVIQFISGLLLSVIDLFI